MRRRRNRNWVGVEVIAGRGSRRQGYYVTGKTDEGKEFQSLEVIEINELTNVFVRIVSNLISKGCCGVDR